MYDTEAQVTKLQNQYNNYDKRSGLYYIIAPQDGFVSKVTKSGIGETIKEGEEVVRISPQHFETAVELWISPVNNPLVHEGENVRIIFDGWPAFVVSGWSQMSTGLFDGTITSIDPAVQENGKFRVWVTPQPGSNWPTMLRMGGGARGILLLNDVPLIYELWRILNGFPPDFYTPATKDKMEAKKMRGLIFFVILYSNIAISQTLSIEEYLSWVIQEHPLSANAKLLTEKGNAQWLQTKGLFDPVLSSKWKNKFYGDKNYYQQSTTTLEIPTPFAIGLNAQLDFNNGAYVNPNDVIPNNGLASFGIALPVLQGLIIDERRMAKRRVERIHAMSELETTIAVNELLYQSCELYLDWLISEKR